jgi:hypothetical protein
MRRKGARSGFAFEGRSGGSKCKSNMVPPFIPLVVRPAHGVHPRHPPRTFPLGLLAPRCLGLARFLTLPHCGAGARAPAVWGKEGILPPASPRLGRARPAGSANPHPRFHVRVFLKIIYFFLLITSALIRESGRPSGNVRGSNAYCTLDPPSRSRVPKPRSQGQKGCERGSLR